MDEWEELRQQQEKTQANVIALLKSLGITVDSPSDFYHILETDTQFVLDTDGRIVLDKAVIKELQNDGNRIGQVILRAQNSIQVNQMLEDYGFTTALLWILEPIIGIPDEWSKTLLTKKGKVK